MKDAQGRQVTGQTRWRRFAVLAVPGFAVTGALAVALANGVVAASFAVSGQEFKVRVDHLEGKGFAQYGSLDTNMRNDVLPVMITTMKEAELTNMCQSVVTSLPIIGDITLTVRAGGKGKPVEAENLFIDATQMSGTPTFKNIEIGRDASTLDKGPEDAKGLQDMFSQQADTISMDNVRQTAWATNAGSFKLSGMSMKLSKGKKECF